MKETPRDPESRIIEEEINDLQEYLSGIPDSLKETGAFDSYKRRIRELEQELLIRGIEKELELKQELLQGQLEATAEIQRLLKQLSQSYPTDTTAEKMIVAVEAIKQIESDPTWKHRVTVAAKTAGLAAFEKAFDNPVVGAFITGAIKGWMEAKAE